MKKITLTGKLSLNKETIAKLNGSQMSQVNGGGSQNHESCTGCDTVYTCPVTSLAACPPQPTIIRCPTIWETEAGCTGC